MSRIAIASGGFDPLHVGHVQYLENSALEADALIVGVNSDEWLKRKKGAFFMPFEERARIVKALRCVDFVVPFDDSDGSARGLIKTVMGMFPGNNQYLFCNGGDRNAKNIPEMDIRDDRLQFVFDIGGVKTGSSSEYLQRWVDIYNEGHTS